MITVKPPASVQAKAGSPVRLDCVVAGSPSPAVYWWREAGDTPGSTPAWHVGTERSNAYMARNNSLVFTAGAGGGAATKDSGHYACVGVNTAGAAIQRSHLLVYDAVDFTGGSGGDNEASIAAHANLYSQAGGEPADLAAARVALMERSVGIRSLYPESATALKVVWRQELGSNGGTADGGGGSPYLEGYYVMYKEYRARGAYSSVKVLHAGATSYSLNRLKECNNS